MKFERMKSDAKNPSRHSHGWQGFFLPYLGTAEAQQDIDNPTINHWRPSCFINVNPADPSSMPFTGNANYPTAQLTRQSAKGFSHGVRQI
jgi:hypothetical protein